MKYRTLGRTGLKVSELGLGGHEYRRPLPTTFDHWGEIDDQKFMNGQSARNILIKNAIDSGISYFDATQTEEAKSLGIALKELGLRDRVHIAAMMISPFKKLSKTQESKWREVVLEEVEDRLKLLQTDYIEIFNIHVPEENYSRSKLQITLQALQEMKSRKKIGWIGASSHEPSFLAEIIRKYDCFDSITVRYNYHLQEARETLFPLCKALDVGVAVMKPFSWPYYGIPFFRFGPHVEDRSSDSTPAQVSLRWILKNHEVSTIVPGTNTIDELRENVAAITKEGKIDENLLAHYLKIAQSPEAKERITEMLKAHEIDIRHFADRTLTELNKLATPTP
jgi:aryl-alcohol dehydrogenase-like predicted oxidoreductase